jgi:O-antigen/teichoic acid export membrane protein
MNNRHTAVPRDNLKAPGPESRGEPTLSSGPATPDMGIGGRLAGWRSRAREVIHEALDGPLIRNAASLYGSTIVTSLLGFVYWLVAARMVSAGAVGAASAIQSAAQLLAIFCVLGLSTLLISELAIDREHARSLTLSAITIAGSVALVVSIIVGVGLQTLSPFISEHGVPAVDVPTFVVLGTLTTVLLVMDDACVGMLRGDLQFNRNAVFAVSKLAILPALIVLWKSYDGSELVLAWTLGLAISFVVLIVQFAHLTRGQSSHLEIKNLLAKRRLMVAHHWLNLSIQAPRLVLPILVATILGARANAAFTAALLIIGFVNIIPAHLSTVMFALVPGDEAALHREVRRSMRICIPLSVVSAVAFLFLSPFVLSLFGPAYSTATHALMLLAFTTFPVTVKALYIAISRVRGRLSMLFGACIELGMAALGAALWGITGVAAGFLAGCVIEMLLFGPLVLRVALSRDVRPEPA